MNKERKAVCDHAYYLAHVAERKAYNAQYHATHSEAKSKRRRSNPEKYRAAEATRYEKHKDEINARSKAYYAAHKRDIAARYVLNKDRCAANHSAYRKTEAGKQVESLSKKKRRALQKQLLHIAPDRVLTRLEWEHIVRLSRGRCYWCHKKMEKATQDHVIPLSKGGLHEASNVVAACLSCNCKKGAKIVTLF